MSAILRLELSIITANREILTPRAGMKHELPAGVVKSPLQNQKNTGALAIFCFSASDNLKDCDLVEVWVCSSIDEEDLVETIIGGTSRDRIIGLIDTTSRRFRYR